MDQTYIEYTFEVFMKWKYIKTPNNKAIIGQIFINKNNNQCNNLFLTRIWNFNLAYSYL